MIAAFRTEITKLRRSLILLTALGGPLCAAAFSFLTLIAKSDPVPWSAFLREGVAMWAYLLLPLSITALTVFLAQLEHGPRLWTHLLVLPVARWKLFAAKAAMTMLLIAGMNAVFFGLLLGIGSVMEALSTTPIFTDAPRPAMLAALLARMTVVAAAMGIVQIWAALAFRSFVPPLILGIVGSVAALGAVASGSGLLLPWGLAAFLLTDAGLAQRALIAGITGGIVLFAAMLAHLGRREWPA
jgi:ABC-2 type transport system permease protein